VSPGRIDQHGQVHPVIIEFALELIAYRDDVLRLQQGEVLSHDLEQFRKARHSKALGEANPNASADSCRIGLQPYAVGFLQKRAGPREEGDALCGQG